MILFIDCEYTGFGGDLISMALLPLDPAGASFYQVVVPPPTATIDSWVADNVLPHIAGEPHATREEFAQALQQYLAQFEAIHLVADWPEDIALFCMALLTGPGMRIDTPPLTMEVRRDIDTELSAVPHHAYHDVVALRRSWIEATGKSE